MKKNLASQSGFFNCRGLATWLLFSAAVPVALYTFGLFSAASAYAQTISQKEKPGTSDVAGEHTTRTGAAPSGRAKDSIHPQASDEDMARSGVALPPVVMAPTRSSFLANWNIVSGATGYRLDVSASGSFNSY